MRGNEQIERWPKQGRCHFCVLTCKPSVFEHRFDELTIKKADMCLLPGAAASAQQTLNVVVWSFIFWASCILHRSDAATTATHVRHSAF
jgi:hypothetical protein